MLIPNSASKTTLETHFETFLKKSNFWRKSCATIRMAKMCDFVKSIPRHQRNLNKRLDTHMKALLLGYPTSTFVLKMDKVEMGFEPSQNPDFRLFSTFYHFHNFSFFPGTGQNYVCMVFFVNKTEFFIKIYPRNMVWVLFEKKNFWRAKYPCIWPYCALSKFGSEAIKKNFFLKNFQNDVPKCP